MKREMIEILACPVDKHHPLDLLECIIKDDIVIEGALYCTDCSRFYPIIDEIPIMLPDELRDKKEELKFLARNEQVLPDSVTKRALPWHL